MTTKRSPYVIRVGPSGEPRPTIRKDPDASLAYGLDLTDWLAGDTVAGVTIAASSEDLTVGTPAYTDTQVSVQVAGGTVGETAYVIFEFSTASGSLDHRTLWFEVVER